MFVRSRQSKGHTYWQAVEGYRDENGVVRQRTFSVWGETLEKALEAEKAALKRHKRNRFTWSYSKNCDPSDIGRKEFDRWDRRVSQTEAKIARLQDALG